MNRDHSAIFEIASKYCILDSFVDYDSYSISSQAVLPTVVDIMSSELNSPIPVHFSSLIPKMSMFPLAISCLTSSRLPWFMDLTFQVPMQSVQFNSSVVSDSLRPHALQHTRPFSPSPAPGVYPNSCPLSRDALQPSYPLSSSSPPAFNLSQRQGLFKRVSSSHQVAQELEFQLQHQSFQWIWTGWISLQSKGLSRVFSNTVVQKHQFFSTQLSLWSNSHNHTQLLENP